ncbi:MAG: penicillin-binding protein 2 [Actinomycetota bacterium]|nr:penicillin-binding protein 2 [Actinomycetota bacterium]
MARRGSALLVATAVVLAVFGLRLVQLQAVQGEALASAALDQRLRTVELPAGRGAILDVNGEPLAVTVEARNLTADQTLVTDPAMVAAALGPILGADIDVLATRLTGDRRFVYLAKGLTPETWDRISALRLPGIFSEPAARRVYPAGDLAANLIGFVGAEGEGLGGIEYAYQDLLAGTPGQQTIERGPGGRVIPTGANTVTDAQHGATIMLTIDRDIQYMAQQAIADKVAESRADSGTLIVMDARTGRILAMATAPTFDPSQATAARASDRGNRALSDVFEPGSTSKLMTIAAVVNEGQANPYSSFVVPNGLTRGDKEFHDISPHGTLKLTLAGIMAKSSNLGTILASERIGGKKLYKYLKKFGIGEPTGLDFPGESTGYVPPHSEWSPTSFPTIAFGQGLSVNAVQSASVFATIANDGVRVEPTIIDSVILPDGSVQELAAPKTTRVVTAETAKQVRAMLETVVGEGGTAPMAAIPGYRVGGKTGTAQAYSEACGCYDDGVVASFIGMAPADAPELVVAVSIFNPREGRYGGELGAPVFRSVMTYALQARQVPPTGNVGPTLPLTYG